MVVFFCVVLAHHLPVRDGFDQHFQATVQFLLTRAMDYTQQHQQLLPQRKFQEDRESNPRQLGQEASMLTIVICCPLPP